MNKKEAEAAVDEILSKHPYAIKDQRLLKRRMANRFLEILHQLEVKHAAELRVVETRFASCGMPDSA